MLDYAILFFIVAVIAAALGFGGFAGLSSDIGWVFTMLALAIMVAGLLDQAMRGGPPASIP